MIRSSVIRTVVWAAFCFALCAVCLPMVIFSDRLIDEITGLVGIAYGTALFWLRCVQRRCCDWKPPSGA